MIEMTNEEYQQELLLRKKEDAEELFPSYAHIWREEPLQGYSLLMRTVSKTFVSIVMVVTEYFLRIGFIDSDGEYHNIKSYRMRYIENYEENPFGGERFLYKEYEPHQEFDDYVEHDRIFKKVIDRMFPNGIPDYPEDLVSSCKEDDLFGLYGVNAWWRYDRANNDVYIIGEGKVDAIRWERTELDDWSPDCIKILGNRDIHHVIVQEGITEFEQYFMMHDRDLHAEEIIFPSTLEKVPFIGVLADKVVIPQTIIEPIWFRSMLFLECGGHYDPIVYSVRDLYLPSTIEFAGDCGDGLPIREDVEHLEQIVLYGDEPIPSFRLDRWVKTNMFYHEIKIRYPEKWDEEAEKSFADIIIESVRLQKPEKITEIYFIDEAEWALWDEEDYEQLRGRIETY